MIALNTQPVEHRDYRDDGSLEIVGDPWYTIQGEGPFVGRPAVFVRLAGCDLQCPECDTDYTTDRKRLGKDDLGLLTIKREWKPNNLIVLTGGEPFRQNIRPFVQDMLYFGREVQIETNGTIYPEVDPPFPFAAERLTIVCSPKTPTIHPKLERWIKAYKYILDADHVADDGLPLTTLGNTTGVARPYKGFDGEVFVQPCEPIVQPSGLHEMELHEATESIHRRNMQACVESCMKHGYRLSLQIHKILNLK